MNEHEDVRSRSTYCLIQIRDRASHVELVHDSENVEVIRTVVAEMGVNSICEIT
jgi:hypothetical protein